MGGALAPGAGDQVEPEEDQLLELCRRKYARKLETDEKGREKVVAALMRLGHGYYDACGAVDTVLAELDEQDEE